MGGQHWQVGMVHATTNCGLLHRGKKTAPGTQNAICAKLPGQRKAELGAVLGPAELNSSGVAAPIRVLQRSLSGSSAKACPVCRGTSARQKTRWIIIIIDGN